jgi:hypothetical protein
MADPLDILGPIDVLGKYQGGGTPTGLDYNSLAALSNNLMPTNTGGLGGMWGKLGDILGNPKFNTGMSAFSNLAGIYTGFKSLGLAEDQLDFSKYSFSKNFNAQARTYNNTLRDQWASRNAAARNRGEQYEGMGSWMKPRQIEKV